MQQRLKTEGSVQGWCPQEAGDGKGGSREWVIWNKTQLGSQGPHPDPCECGDKGLKSSQRMEEGKKCFYREILSVFGHSISHSISHHPSASNCSLSLDLPVSLPGCSLPQLSNHNPWIAHSTPICPSSIYRPKVWLKPLLTFDNDLALL